MLTILQTLAQASSSLDGYSYTTSSTGGDAASAGMAIGLMLGIFVFILFTYLIFGFITMKIFKKAGRQDAWAAFVPIYNNYVYFEVAGRPGWWAFLVLLGFIPFVGGVIAFVTMFLGSIDMAKSFGKETGFGILLALVPIVGLPMLAFGDATYQGPAGPEGGNQAPQAPNAPTMTPPQPPTQPLV